MNRLLYVLWAVVMAAVMGSTVALIAWIVLYYGVV